MIKKWIAIGMAGILAFGTTAAAASMPQEVTALEDQIETEDAESLSDDGEEEVLEESDSEESDEVSPADISGSLQTEEETSLKNTAGLSAANLTFGQKVYGNIAASDDEDWYRFTLPSSGRITMVSNAKINNIAYELYDASEKNLWFDSPSAYPDPQTNPIKLTKTFDLTKGTYYLKVYSSYYQGNYDLTLTFASAGETFEETGNGNNNSFGAADMISTGEKYLGQIAMTDEDDYYEIQLPSSGRITLKSKADLPNLAYQIYDTSGESLWFHSATTYPDPQTNPIDITKTIDLTKGTYYLKIYSGYYTGNYEFTVNFSSAKESFTETGNGTNNSFDTADSIAMGTKYMGQFALTDYDDYYQFTLPTAGKITLTTNATLPNLAYELYDASREQIWFESPGSYPAGTPIHLTKSTSLGKGTYYLRISSFYTGNYDFTVKFASNVKVPTVKMKSVKMADAHSIKVTWEGVSGATNYQVYRKAAGGSWKKLALVKGTSYTDKAAVPNQYYYYTVRAYKGSIQSSSYQSSKKVRATIAAPKLGKLSRASYQSLKLTWGKVSGASGYQVYRKTAGTGWKKIKEVTGTSYTNSSLKTGTSYTYTVRAMVKLKGKTYLSGYDKKGLSGTPRLSTPKISSAVSTKSGIQLSWKSITGANGYQVYRKTASGWKKIGTTSKNTYIDKSTKKGSSYRYTVRAYRTVSGKKVLSSYDTKGTVVKRK